MPFQFTVRLEHHEAPHAPGSVRSFNISEFRNGRTIPSTVDYMIRAAAFGEGYEIEVWELAAHEQVRFGRASPAATAVAYRESPQPAEGAEG